MKATCSPTYKSKHTSKDALGFAENESGLKRFLSYLNTVPEGRMAMRKMLAQLSQEVGGV